MASKYEMSKTYQYRKVMKPLLERKRRARINKCLDDLKDLMSECFKQEAAADGTQKFEKSDILEVTVQHLRKLKAQKQQTAQNNLSSQQSFRSGYIQAANEVSRCMATLPNIDVAFGTKLMTHLGLRLSQLESPQEQPLAVSTPLSVTCASSQSTAASAMYSPVSSGYASDCDSSLSSSSSSSRSRSPALAQKQGLLQVSTNAPVWRPW